MLRIGAMEKEMLSQRSAIIHGENMQGNFGSNIRRSDPVIPLGPNLDQPFEIQLYQTKAKKLRELKMAKTGYQGWAIAYSKRPIYSPVSDSATLLGLLYLGNVTNLISF